MGDDPIMGHQPTWTLDVPPRAVKPASEVDLKRTSAAGAEKKLTKLMW